MKKLTLILIIGGLALLLFLATPVRADHGDSNPPEIGDWHIRNDTFVSNTSILMNGNISLEKDVSLTFLNVSLTFNSTDSLRYYIETLGDDSWSNLSILDSRLQGLSQSETFYIWFKSHGKIRLENSGFRYCFGISIQDARVIVLGSVFTEMTMTALSLSATAADSIIKDNTFHNLRYGVALGEFHADSSVLIQNNNFYLGVRGLWISSMSRTGPKIVIEKNNFSRFSLKAISISQFQNSYLVQNNYICDSYVGVSFSVEGRNGYDTSHSARFSNMSFDNCHTVYESGDPGGFVARTAMVVNNSFVNCTGVHASLNMTRLLTQDSPFEMDKMIINDELSSATVNWSKTLRVMSQDGFPLEDTRVWLQGEENQSTCVLTDQEGLYSFQLTGFWINQTQKRDLRNYDFCLEKGYVNTSIHFTLHNNTPLEVVLEMDRHNVPSQHFLLRTESSVLEALPKESLELLVELVNAGWENDSYFIKAQDSPWLDIDLEDPFPFLGSNRTTTIRLQVWLSDRALAGQEFPLELLVHSAGNRSLVKAVNFTVRVGAAPGFWLEANLPDQIDQIGRAHV